MDTILLGTTSDAKLNIIKDIVKDSYNVVPVDVDSGISDQPLDEETTIQGAINRAKQATLETHDYEFSIGLEGGLSKINGIYCLVCVSAIVDKKDNVYIGVSNKLPLPKEVSEKVLRGEQFGEVIREFMKNTKEVAPEFLDHIRELIERKKSFTSAFRTSFLRYRSNAKSKNLSRYARSD